ERQRRHRVCRQLCCDTELDGNMAEQKCLGRANPGSEDSGVDTTTVRPRGDMFERAISDLEKLGRGVRISIQLPLDEQGYMDRRCPASKCHTEFKICFEDWRNKVRDELVYCPICRHESPSTEWNTVAQQEHIEQVAL